MLLTQYAQQVMERCETLAKISQCANYIDRRYLTPEHKLANLQVADWMNTAGLQTWQDEAGNQWGRYTSPVANAKTLIIGSHLDTVPNSGKYDGILGVLLPISLIQAKIEHNHSLPFNIDIVAFADEEGTRFGATLLGSRAVAGTWQDEWAKLKDENGVSLAEAMTEFGLDIKQVSSATRSVQSQLGFFEVHIEQGPVLEAEELAVGIVSGIAGARRFNISVTGQAGHAGTVPMAMRQDAMSAAAEMILCIESLALKNQLVATVGCISASPNAVNVIAGRVEFSLDIRSMDDSKRDTTVDVIEQALNTIAEQRNVRINIEQTHSAQAVMCDENIMNLLSIGLTSVGLTDYTLASGAGHDAMAMANLCPTGMLFVRCDKGISHHPAEAVMVSDVEIAMRAVDSFLQALSEQVIAQS